MQLLAEQEATMAEEKKAYQRQEAIFQKAKDMIATELSNKPGWGSMIIAPGSKVAEARLNMSKRKALEQQSPPAPWRNARRWLDTPPRKSTRRT